MKQTLLTTATALSIAAGAAVAATNVKEVDVEADVNVIENAAAAQVWSNFEGDLETAIAERIVNQLDDRGARVLIDMESIEIANGFETTAGLADAELSGQVKIKVPGLANNENYDLRVTAEQVQSSMPLSGEATTGTVSSQTFYVAMIDAFADNVVEKLQ